jgi:hypothetical protein
MTDFISQVLAGLGSKKQPDQLAFVNGMPVINPAYNGPAVQRAQFLQPPALQARINEMLGSLQYQDQWMQHMRLPLERKVNNMLGESIWPQLR